MEIKQDIIDMILKFVTEHPEFGFVALFTDGIGGWEMYFCRTKDEATKRTQGIKNSEVVIIED